MDRSRDVFTAFHIPIYDKPGFEADDIIGTIAHISSLDSFYKFSIITHQSW
jgi:5'-3' exonuclease